MSRPALIIVAGVRSLFSTEDTVSELNYIFLFSDVINQKSPCFCPSQKLSSATFCVRQRCREELKPTARAKSHLFLNFVRGKCLQILGKFNQREGPTEQERLCFVGAY